MNILFVCHNGIATNSGNHVSNFAHALSKLGVDVVAAVPDDSFAPSPSLSPSACPVISWTDARSYRFADGNEADFIHAWTPRQHVANITRKLSFLHGCDYLVHLEDNEYVVTSSQLGITQSELISRPRDLKIPQTLADPEDMHDFISASAGVTALIKSLLKFKPGNLPGTEIWPSAETDIFHPQMADRSLRRHIGVPDDSKVIVYHGNVHAANVHEVRSLYLAIAALARSGTRITLVRMGMDFVELVPDSLKSVEAHVIRVPFQPRERLPHYLALADLFVQPGRVDEFNIYRFPSKLPEFFAMGKPVILPATNLGKELSHRQNAFLLRNGDGLEIANAILEILGDDVLAATLGAGAKQFFDANMSWDRSAEKLKRFYEDIDCRLSVY
jgi:glycosyltransferase involved in cell wall biosynthesis